MEVKCHSVEETQKFALEFSKTIEMGSIISLNGGLGAGKTTFAQGFARGMGV